MTEDRPPSPAETLLLRGGTLLTLDAAATVLPGADLLVREGRIAAVGAVGPPPAGARVLDAAGCLVLPGLIQGHVHLGQTGFRGLAEGRPLLAWLRERIWPLEAAHDAESAYWTSLWGAAECLLGGTTTIQDIGLGPGVRGLLAAIADSGLRALAGLCLMDGGEGLPDALRQDADDALAAAVELAAGFDGAGGGRRRYVLNPRFILSCSDELWRGLRDLSLGRGWPVHTHALEQRQEGEAVRRLKGGRDEIAYFDDEGVLATDLRIAHGVCLLPEHLARVRRGRFSVVSCPSSNLKLGSGIADLVAIRGAGVPVGVGADATPCNNALDALTEVRLAALLQTLRHGPGALSGLDALRLATSEGARALGLGEEVGSLEVGKAADLVVLAGDRPELWAADGVDPHDRVVFSASRATVRHVVVAGEVLVEEGRLTRLDLAEIRRRALASLAALVRRARL
jgi:5-methylthioadenosine/S-adenosylhomocysteine deaminase